MSSSSPSSSRTVTTGFVNDPTTHDDAVLDGRRSQKQSDETHDGPLSTVVDASVKETENSEVTVSPQQRCRCPGRSYGRCQDCFMSPSNILFCDHDHRDGCPEKPQDSEDSEDCDPTKGATSYIILYF